MQNDLPFIFERNLYRAVVRYKQEHPGELEERTKRRRMNEQSHESGRSHAVTAWCSSTNTSRISFFG